MEHQAGPVIFGLDPMLLSATVLVVVYVALFIEKIHRTVIALLGAGVVIISGLLTQDEAIAGIDFNTIALLTGMMIIVSVIRETGLFEFMAIWAAKLVRADPRGILLVLAVVTAVFSAFLDNMTTVILVVPVALVIVEKLKLSPYPFLISQILASNIGGSATLIGDPPNILIGSATGLTFNEFLIHMGPIAVVCLVMTLFITDLLWGRKLSVTPELRERIMRFDDENSITEPEVLRKSLIVLGLVIAGFVVGENYHVPPGTTAMFGAAVLLFVLSLGQTRFAQTRRLHDAFGNVEWGVLFFFIGLFIVVHGVEKSGLLALLGGSLLEMVGNDPLAVSMTIMWLSAVASSVVDNIPFVATMIPLVESMGGDIGGAHGIEPVWWALALGACLGGNGSLVGAAANVMVAGLAERAGTPLNFGRFLLIAAPLTVLTVAVASVGLYIDFFL